MSRQLSAALAFLLLVSRSASAQAPLERALGEVTWGMSQAEVKKRLGAAITASSTLAPVRPLRNEQVLAARDAFSRSFYYFRSGKLRKIYSVLEPAAFPEGNFVAFATTLERRFGPGRHRESQLAPGVTRRWIEWRQGHIRLRLLDQSYYVLVYEQV